MLPEKHGHTTQKLFPEYPVNPLINLDSKELTQIEKMTIHCLKKIFSATPPLENLRGTDVNLLAHSSYI